MFQGWILSQLLILIYYYIDTGVQICGLDFHFDNPDEDEEAASIENPDDNHDDKPDNSPDDNPDEETATADMSVNSHGKVCRFCRYISGKFQNMTTDQN